MSKITDRVGQARPKSIHLTLSSLVILNQVLLDHALMSLKVSGLQLLKIWVNKSILRARKSVDISL